MSKEFPNKRDKKIPIKEIKKKNRVFLSTAQKNPNQIDKQASHFHIFILLSSDLSMSSSVSAASHNLSFYFHVPLLSQPCLSFFFFFKPFNPSLSLSHFYPFLRVDKVEHVAIIYWFLGLSGHHVTRKFKILLLFAHIVILVLSHIYIFKKTEICNYNM